MAYQSFLDKVNGKIMETFFSFYTKVVNNLGFLKTAVEESNGEIVLAYGLVPGDFEGNVEFQIEGADDIAFTTNLVQLDTGSDKTDWIAFNGATWEALPAVGFPTVWEIAAYTGTSLASSKYKRWRAYQDDSVYPVEGDWVGGVNAYLIGGRTDNPVLALDILSGAKFYFRDSTGTRVASLDESGDLRLKGSVYENVPTV